MEYSYSLNITFIVFVLYITAWNVEVFFLDNIQFFISVIWGLENMDCEDNILEHVITFLRQL